MNAPFDIDVAMERLEEAVAPYPKAALFELAEDGYSTPFQQAVACIISIRTMDEVTLPTSRKLFEQAPGPQTIAELSEAEIDDLIHACSFHEQKAAWIHAMAEEVISQYDGEVPCDRDTLTGFSGIGAKCANLVLGIACHQPRVSVDVHVHRITNRWGYVATKHPEQTMRVLEDKLPGPYWIDINRLLIPFGKHICTRTRPKCSTCPLEAMCAQVGVENPR